MNIVVQEDIEDRFRRTVTNTKGFRKGNMSIALQEVFGTMDKRADKA